MTQRFGFFDSVNHDRRYNSTDISRMFDGLIRDGIYLNYLESFAVQPAGGMDIWIRPGRCWFNHRWFECDEPVKLRLNNAHTVWSRLDVIVIEVNDAETVRSVSLRIMQGPPGSTPTEPPIGGSPTLHRYPIAAIKIEPRLTEITTAHIYDRRGTDACPWVANINGSVSTKMLTDQFSSEFQAWFSALKTVALTPPNANVELAAVKQEVAKFKERWDTGAMQPGGISDNTRIPLINPNGTTATSAVSGFAYEIFDGIPSAHNALYRGKNLGTIMTAEQAAEIEAGTFKDLWLGDYWTGDGREYVIAGFDYWLGLRNVTKHHIAVVPKYSVSGTPMHSSGTMPRGPYYTDMYQTTLPSYRPQFESVFGNRIIKHPVTFVSEYDEHSDPKDYSSFDIDISVPDPGMVSTSGISVGVRNSVTMARSSGSRLLPIVLFNSAFANTSTDVGYWVNASYGPRSAAFMQRDGSFDQSDPTIARFLWPIFAVGG